MIVRWLKQIKNKFMILKRLVILTTLFISSFCVNGQEKNENTDTQETKTYSKPEDTEVYTPVPEIVKPYSQNGVPSDAIVLFDGSNLDEWVMVRGGGVPTWKLDTANKTMTIDKGVEKKNATLKTKKKFGSMQLHLEWKSPKNTGKKGQDRGNSGIYIQERYEVQILDNNDNETYTNGQVGSVYKQTVPLANALVPTEKWNTYDIIFHAPKFENEKLVAPATITLLHNGVLVLDDFTIQGATEYIGLPSYKAHGKASIKLQDHESAVGFRNIWVRELDE